MAAASGGNSVRFASKILANFNGLLIKQMRFGTKQLLNIGVFIKLKCKNNTTSQKI